MIRSLLIVALVGSASSQYVQQSSRAAVQQQQQSVQAAQQQPVDDQIPAWYQMAKPVQAARALPQASPSYYERHEPTYEQRREQAPTYERPGIQTNQYANYPSYSNRQPYENLNALTSGASLSNLQASRRYPAAAGAAGSDMPYDSALKRYHKLLLKRRQWTTKIGRILASTTPMTPSTTITTTTTVPTTTTTRATTTKKMPKSLKSIYSTINPRTTTTEEEEVVTTEATTARAKVTPRLVGKPRGTFKPHGTRKGWRMWKKVTPKYVAKLSTTTTEAPTSSTTSTTELSTSGSSSESTQGVTSATSTASTTSTTTTTSTTSTSEPVIPELPLIEEEQEVTTTEEPTTEESTTTTTTTTTTTEPATTTKEDRAPSRPIAVGHKWKPLRFKKPEPSEVVTTIPEGVASKPRGLRLLEYLLKQTDTFAKGLQKAIDGPNTELLAAIKDVVAKFKASLDEAGIDQDVRLMGNQLKNTWQQLRTGPMNEQIGRLFEKAVADAADQKQAQQLQQIQQQLAPTRP